MNSHRRFLAFFSYNGKGFHGILKDHRLRKLNDHRDIFGSLNESLCQFNKNHKRLDIKKEGYDLHNIRISSRTDVGVHASMNSFTFNSSDNSEFDFSKFKKGMNHWFIKQGMQINVNRIYPLRIEANDYDCRASCLERQYTYKILLLKGADFNRLLDLKYKLELFTDNLVLV